MSKAIPTISEPRGQENNAHDAWDEVIAATKVLQSISWLSAWLRTKAAWKAADRAFKAINWGSAWCNGGAGLTDEEREQLGKDLNVIEALYLTRYKWHYEIVHPHGKNHKKYKK